MQIKTIMRYHYTSTRMANIWTMMIPKLARIWSNRNSHKLLVGMKNGITTLEDSSALCFFTKLNILLPYDPEIVLLGIFSKELETFLHKNLCMDVYSNFNHNCQIFKATKIFQLVNDKLWYIQTLDIIQP